MAETDAMSEREPERGDRAPGEAGASALTSTPVERPGSDWDAFLETQPDATFAHLSAWRDIISEAMGHEPVYLAARDGAGRLAGVLPLFALRSPLFGRRLVSVPLLSYGGPVGSAAAVAALVDAAVEEGRRRRVRALELRARTEVPSSLRPTTRKVTVLLPLPADPEELWTGLKAKVRSQVRRPMKEGLEARFGPGEVEPFYHVLSRNMRDVGTPVLPGSLFQRLAAAFGEGVVFGTVRRQGEPVAAGAGFVFRGEFEITWASSLREHNRSAPNMLLYWSFMERMARQGVRTFNFGRCTPGGGTHRFKLQWGGTDLPLPWLTWPEPEGDGDGSPGRLSRLLSTAWQRLPMGVANRAGPLVARQLPWW
jgi:FemAB-related protein (PEP-CTERM system-associated)